MAVDERRGSVVFAEQAAVDVVEPIPGDQPVPAGGTRETLQKRREPITNGPLDQGSGPPAKNQPAFCSFTACLMSVASNANTLQNS